MPGLRNVFCHQQSLGMLDITTTTRVAGRRTRSVERSWRPGPVTFCMYNMSHVLYHQHGSQVSMPCIG
jgi:hypothetical protein